MLAVHAPPSTENSAQFCAVADHLRGAGVRTPEILAKDTARGFLLVEDFGGYTLLDQLSESNVDTFYNAAFKTLLMIQRSEPNADLYPVYSDALLRQEMDLFDEWFVQRWLDIDIADEYARAVDTAKEMVIEAVSEQTKVLVHRDYHSRNLMVIEGGDLGVLDFQDAVIGPWTYDLVSLLKDCYVRWSPEQVERWALQYAYQAAELGIVSSIDDESFIKCFDFMGLQRHIKVLGIFCRLHLRDSKPGYMKDLPRVFRYVREVVGKYEELSEFNAFFDELIVPAFEQRSTSL
jgi:aminoglycoside/choline kinase family phosphotransferase